MHHESLTGESELDQIMRPVKMNTPIVGMYLFVSLAQKINNSKINQQKVTLELSFQLWVDASITIIPHLTIEYTAPLYKEPNMSLQESKKRKQCRCSAHLLPVSLSITLPKQVDRDTARHFASCIAYNNPA